MYNKYTSIIYIYIYIFIVCSQYIFASERWTPSEIDLGLCLAVFAGSEGKKLFHRIGQIHPVRIARLRLPRFAPKVGLPRNRFLMGSLTAALRFSKGWVQKDANIGLRTGCSATRLNCANQACEYLKYRHGELANYCDLLFRH